MGSWMICTTIVKLLEQKVFKKELLIRSGAIHDDDLEEDGSKEDMALLSMRA
ncbi:hypothetical protein Tco_0499995, partial [Tanacetum coccineum]